MLAAELRGKISAAHPPHQRMEDVLTSHVFSMFTYLEDLSLPTAWLCEARNGTTALDVEGLQSAFVYFWPRFNFSGLGFREPDLLLVLKNAAGDTTVAVIEAKYDARLHNKVNNKSKDSTEDDSHPNVAIEYGHQLADQFCGLHCGHWRLDGEVQKELAEASKRIAIYVTAHYELPKLDLEAATVSVQHRAEKSCSQGCFGEPSTDIYWLGWRSLYELLSTKLRSCNGAGFAYLSDLRDVLESRGLVPFEAPFVGLLDVEPYQSLWESTSSLPTTPSKLWSNLADPGVYKPLF